MHLLFIGLVMSDSLRPRGLSMPGFPVLHHLLEFANIHVYWVDDAIYPSYFLFPPSSSFNLSQHQDLFQWVSSLHQVAKVLELQPSISPSNEYSGLNYFRIDFDLPAVQGTLKSLLQHHYLKASILWCSVFFMVQLSHPYMTAGKTIALLYGPLSAKWWLCFLTHCLGLS